MITMEERVANLERRVAEVEGGLSFLIPQVREFHVAFLRFAEVTDRRFGQVDTQLKQLDAKIDTKFDFLDSKFTNLFKGLDEKVDALPRVVAELLREELQKAKE